MKKPVDKKKLFKILLPAVIVLLFFFFLFLPSLVESYLSDSLKELGLKDPRLTVRHVGINQLDIRRLSLGEPGNPDLIIPTLAMDFSWIDLLKGRVRKIEISGMKLNVAAGKEGITVKGLEPLFNTKSEGKPTLPVNRIEIDSSVIQVDWEGRSLAIPFSLSAVTGGADRMVSFSMDLTPYGEAIAVKGTLNMDSGAGAITVAADDAHLEKYFNDFNITFFQWLKSRVQLKAEINVADWGIRDSHISLAIPAFSAGFPGGNLKGSVNLDFKLDQNLLPQDVRMKLRFEGINDKNFKIEIPFDLDIDGSRLDALQFKLAELRFQQPPGICFKDFAGTASLAAGQMQVRGSYECAIDPGFVSWLSPALEMEGKLEIKGNVTVRSNDKGAEWNLDGKGRGKVFLATKNTKTIQAGMENLALSFASTGKGTTIKNRLDVELKGVAIQYEDKVFSAGNILSQNSIETADGKNWTGGGRLKMTAARVKQTNGIAAEGIGIDASWQYPFTAGLNPGNWAIASLKLGDLDLGKLSGELKQKENGVDFSGTAHTPVEALKIQVNGTCQWLEPQTGIDALLQVEVPEIQITRDSQLSRLHPALTGYRWAGYISGTGTVSFLQGNLTSRARLNLRDLEMESDTGGLKCRGMKAEILFSDLLDFQTGVSQRIDFKSVDVSGMQLNEGHLVFEIISADSIYIEGGEFAFSGGRILLQPLRFDLKGEELKVTLYGDRIDFAKMVNALQGDKIASGGAELNGMITVGLSDGIPVFRDGYLYSTPGVGGNIKFLRSDAISGGVLLVEEAIKDFNYEWIKLKINTNILNDKLNITAYINGVPARKLPLTYDTKSKDIVREKGGKRNLELKGLLLELRFNDLDLKRLMKGGMKIYSQDKKMP